MLARNRWRSSVSVSRPCWERVQEHHYGSSEDSFGIGFATRTCHVDVAERRQGGGWECWKFRGFEPFGGGRWVDPWTKVETWCTKHIKTSSFQHRPHVVLHVLTKSQSCCRFYHLQVPFVSFNYGVFSVPSKSDSKWVNVNLLSWAKNP